MANRPYPGFAHPCRLWLWWIPWLLLLIGCGQSPRPLHLNGKIFGTSYSLVVADEVARPEELRAAISTRLEQIDWSMSSWKQDSELNRLLRQPLGEWVQISPDLARVLKLSWQVYLATDGAFDPSMGGLIRLWGFQDEVRITPPLPQEVQQALALIGFDKLELDGLRARRLKDIDINLSAVAKGYAVDRVAELLKAHGINNYLVEIGGELVTRGSKHGKPWTVAIEAPRPGSRSVQQLIQPGDAALATSGNYRNFFASGGKHYQHIIDPRSGYPSDNQLVLASVIAADCATADAYATAFMVMGTAALDKAKVLGLETMLLVAKGQEVETLATDGFAAYFVK